MDDVFEYTIPKLMTLTASARIRRHLPLYLNRIRGTKEDEVAKVSYYFSSPKGTLKIWHDGLNQLGSAIEISSKEIKALPVFFETRYFFRIDFDETVKNARIIHPLASVSDCFNFSLRTFVGTLDFVNTLGRFNLTLEIQKVDSVQIITMSFMVVSVKMDVAHDYQTILTTITKESKHLVHTFFSKTLGNAGYAPNEGAPPPNFIWYAIFLKVLDFYFSSCKRIIHKPHLKYVSQVFFQKADRIKQWSPQLVNQFSAMDHSRKQHHYFRSEYINPETNTIENRFIFFTLQELSRKLSSFAVKLRSFSEISVDYISQIDEQVQSLDRLAKHSFFKGIDRFRGFRQESIVLQKRQGYAQVYTTWLTLKNTLDPIDKDVNIGYRPISTLYEFWCFLTIRDMLTSHFGEPDNTIGNVNNFNELFDDVDAKFDVGRHSLCKMDYTFIDKKLNREITLSYQKSYNTSPDQENFAYLNSQRPDIILTIQETDIEQDKKVFTYLFDAKYRISPNENLDASPRDAIDDMHRYRDAILYRKQKKNSLHHEIVGAYVLFPGRPQPESYDYTSVILAENIGAIPLLPSEEGQAALRLFLDEVLGKQGADAHLQSSIPQRGTILQIDSADAIKKVSVYGTTHGKKQLEWMQEYKCYILPTEEATSQGIITEEDAKEKLWLLLTPSQRSSELGIKVCRIKGFIASVSDVELKENYKYFKPPSSTSYWMWEIEVSTLLEPEEPSTQA